MTESRPARDRRLPAGFLGMLALVLAVEAAIASRRLDFTTVWADDWRCAAEAAATRAKGLDVLCFGDSLVKFGVLPRSIGAKARLRTFNFAINAGTMPSTYFLFRRALDSGARPKAVVVDFFPLMIPDRPPRSIRLYPDLATVAECVDLARVARDPDFLGSTLLGKVLPSYKCRHEIRASVARAFEGRRASPWPALASIWKQWKAHRGAQPHPPEKARGAVDPKLVADVSPADWSCDPINAEYFERFLALAGSRRIPVFWLMPPLGPEVRDRRKAFGSEDAYDRFAREALARHPGVVVLDARGANFDDSYYVDAIHLDVRGAEALTDDLARVLVDRLRPGGGRDGRWVALPDHAPGRRVASGPGRGEGR